MLQNLQMRPIPELMDDYNKTLTEFKVPPLKLARKESLDPSKIIFPQSDESPFWMLTSPRHWALTALNVGLQSMRAEELRRQKCEQSRLKALVTSPGTLLHNATSWRPWCHSDDPMTVHN
jgi:hypothetical protein